MLHSPGFKPDLCVIALQVLAGVVLKGHQPGLLESDVKKTSPAIPPPFPGPWLCEQCLLLRLFYQKSLTLIPGAEAKELFLT